MDCVLFLKLLCSQITISEIIYVRLKYPYIDVWILPVLISDWANTFFMERLTCFSCVLYWSNNLQMIWKLKLKTHLNVQSHKLFYCTQSLWHYLILLDVIPRVLTLQYICLFGRFPIDTSLSSGFSSISYIMYRLGSLKLWQNK